MRGEHEIDAAAAHRIHQRQHIAARDAEAVANAGLAQGRDDKVRVVHDREADAAGTNYFAGAGSFSSTSFTAPTQPCSVMSQITPSGPRYFTS